MTNHKTATLKRHGGSIQMSMLPITIKACWYVTPPTVTKHEEKGI